MDRILFVMADMTSNEIECIINKNYNSVVTYLSKDHHGYKNEDLTCIGLIFNSDLYLFLEGKNNSIEPLPYYCVESETRINKKKGFKQIRNN